MSEQKISDIFRFFAKEHLDIIDLPIEQQANYAEAPCEFIAQDEKLATEQLEGSEGSENYKKWNASSVGCLAYMALHACTPALRLAYSNRLRDYISWFKEQNFTCEKLVTIMWNG